MGLFGSTHLHTHRHDNSTNIRFPDTIVEKKAPTDESVRLLNEMQEKTLQNLIAMVEVKDNLVEGTCHAFNNIHTTMQYMVTLIFKFKINGKEFVVNKQIMESDLYKDGKEFANIQNVITDYAKSVMLWYALKSFVMVAFEQITNTKPPEYLLNS